MAEAKWNTSFGKRRVQTVAFDGEMMDEVLREGASEIQGEVEESSPTSLHSARFFLGTRLPTDIAVT